MWSSLVYNMMSLLMQEEASVTGLGKDNIIIMEKRVCDISN